MIATGKRAIKDGKEFDHLFDRPIGKNITTSKNANVSDTVSLMKDVISKTLSQTKAIANVLKRSSERKTCKAIWDFCFNHFQYTRDATGIEQVRFPSRSWADRFKGIDCDCFTVLIGSILSNLNISFVIRLTKYTSSQFEHVYPVVITNEGQEIIIDCVVHKFNYEVNYTEKKDIEMELEYLNGVPQERFNEFGDLVRFENDLPIDAEDLFLDEMELEGLEGRTERLARKAKRQTKRTEKKVARKANNAAIKALPKKERVKARLRQGLNVVNKFNPATALLRAGVLASMKLNIFKVASKLRFGYWTDAQAQRNNMNMGKFGALKTVMAKIQKVYYGAGGNPDKLKQAILTGKGNRNRMVGLNGIGAVEFMNDEQDLETILGYDLFDEIGASSLSGLGEVTTAAAIASATGLMGVIAGLLKKLGGLFNVGTPQADQEMIQDNTDEQEEQKRKFSFKNLRGKAERFVAKVTGGSASSDGSGDEIAITKNNVNDGIETEDFEIPDDFDAKNFEAEGDLDDLVEKTKDSDSKGGVMAWVKENPMAATGIGVGAAGVIGLIAWNVIKNGKKKKTLSGVPKRRTSKKAKPTLRKRTRKTSVKPSKPRAHSTRTKQKVRAITLK